MVFGNMPRDGGNLLMSIEEMKAIKLNHPDAASFLKIFLGSDDVINGTQRASVWVSEENRHEAEAIAVLSERFHRTRENRLCSNAASTKQYANKPYSLFRFKGCQETFFDCT